MATVGESGGNLDEMLNNVSEYYEANVNQRITTFTAMVEPIIILMMGAVIAFVLVSILLPLFEMNKILIKK
jgi:general secretion pathway protein F